MKLKERLYRVQAIVLRRRDWGEADRLLTLYTRERGKLQAVAKGARKPASRKTGHVELFSRVQLLIARGRSLDIVTQAEMVEPYQAIRESLERSSLAHYMAELLDRFSGEGEAEPDMFELLAGGLSWLCQASDEAHLRLAARYYELHLLELAGFRPELESCPVCGQTLEPVDCFFSPADGGVLCPRCGEGKREALALSLAAFKVLRYGQRRDWSIFSRLQLQPALQAELERVMHHYLTFILERQLKSVDFIHRLRREQLVDHE